MLVKAPHHEILAKRIRNERVELFARITQAEKALRAMLDTFTKNVTAQVNDKGTALRNLRVINAKLHNETVILRGAMRTWFGALIKDATKMGFRHIGDALLPVFKDNREAIATEIVAGQALFEAKLTFGMDDGFARRAKPTVSLSTAKWGNAASRIFKNLTSKAPFGLKPADRIWDLTGRAEQDLKRIIANGISNGDSPYAISKRIEKYISPKVTSANELGIQMGPGVYRSPYRNAMRLARTETNRAYTQAQAAFAKDKPWVEAVAITLSPVHDVEDDCDDLADQGPYSPDEAAQLLPVHPHCMCYLTPIIDPKYLGQEEES